MEFDQGNREDQGGEDLSESTLIVDPLAELATDLALSVIAIEEHRGSFCDWCTCQLGFHIAVDDLSCELCGCPEPHISPNRNLTYMPMKDKRKYKQERTMGRDIRRAGIYGEYTREPYERAKAAREALKELTE